MESVQQVIFQARDALKEAVSTVSAQGVKEQAKTTLAQLTKAQKRNASVLALLLLLSALVKQKRAALLSILINLFFFRFHAWPLQSEKLYDVAGAITNLSLAVFSVAANRGPFDKDQIFNTLSSVAWSVRIGNFLLTRILVQGKDARFAEIKKNYDALFFAFALQAVWCFVGQLPVLVSNACKKKKQEEEPARSSSYWQTLGRLLFVLGFGMEIVSDAQKTAFNFNWKEGEQEFITTGLWQYSRHPNYLGEIMLQFGLTLACSERFVGMDHLAWLSPALTTVLLTRVSGIPMLESAGLERWGSNPKYQQYLRDTPVLLPKFF